MPNQGTRNFLKAALDYEKQGFSVIPIIAGQKKAAIPWTEYQKRRATPEEIAEWWHQSPQNNIGIVTGKVSDLFVVDLDKYKKEYDPAIELEHFETIETPVAESPNGGTHLYMKFCEGLTIASGVFPAIDIRGEGGYIIAPPSVNGNGKPYKWIVSPKDQIMAALPASFQASINNKEKKLYKERPNTVSSVSTTTADNAHKCLQDGNRNSDIFTIMYTMAKGGLQFEIAKEVVDILVKNANPPYDLKEAYASLESAYKRKESRERNIQEEVREYVLQQKSLHETHILSTECLRSLQLLTRQEKNAGYTAINRLCNAEKILEKHEGVRSSFRILDNKVEEAKMDLLSESDVQEFKVSLPLDLGKMCILSPGNIVVVSGSKSAGKTAMMMNIAWRNQDNYEVVYLNSEMHETEFKKRMKKFGPLSKWHIQGYKCHNNFTDYIKSDKPRIYIVDFLEIHDNFFEIAKPIRAIHEKLGDSLCFIAVQMKLGASLGRGGDFSAEKARLYLTMDYVEAQLKTRLTIYDAKEPRPPYETVRGLTQMVKIIGGNEMNGEGWPEAKNRISATPAADCRPSDTAKWYEK